MRIEFVVPFRRVATPQTTMIEAHPEPQGRPPRIARLVALAHKLDAMVHSGAVADYAALGRLGHVSPARITQIMVLLHLAPPLKEYLLFLPAGDARFFTELGLRKIAREPRWDRQRQLFEALLKK